MKYFSIKELTYSATAKKYKIDNTPNDTELQHLEELGDFLDGVRAAWGSAILVSSGFRCEELNAKVGGSKNSGHKYGWAVDLIPCNNKKLKFFEFMKTYLEDKPFDELIFETNSQGATWCHFSLKSYQGKQRRKVKMLNA